MGVAAVDENVSRLKQRRDLGDDLIDGRAIIITFRGRFSAATNSLTERQPMIFFPRARPAKNCSTRATVRLNTATVKPWLSMFSTRFSPMTARPIRPMSALAAVIAQTLENGMV
jgi:hypothetical protein